MRKLCTKRVLSLIMTLVMVFSFTMVASATTAISAEDDINAGQDIMPLAEDILLTGAGTSSTVADERSFSIPWFRTATPYVTINVMSGCTVHFSILDKNNNIISSETYTFPSNGGITVKLGNSTLSSGSYKFKVRFFQAGVTYSWQLFYTY